MSTIVIDGAQLEQEAPLATRRSTLMDRARSLGARPGLRVAVTYAVLALAADLPIYPGDPSRLPTIPQGDIVQTVWFLAWTPFALLHGHNPFVTHFINFPKGVNLAQNTGIFLLGLLAAPLTLLAGPVASMNLLRWIAFWLSAYAAFAVIRKWVPSSKAAFVGGLLYGFSPYMAAEGSLHLDLIFVPLPPVIFYLSYELLVAQRRSAVRGGVLLALCCVAQFYIEAEVLATTMIVVATGAVVLAVGRFSRIKDRLGHGVIGLGVALGVALPLIAYPAWILMHGPAHYAGPAQGVHNVYNADLLGPIVPSVNQLLAPAHFRAIGTGFVGNNPQENGSYLGIPLLLLVLLIVGRYWRRGWPVFFAAMIVVIFAFSLGPVLVVDGIVRHVPFPLPFAKMLSVPVLNNILPVRFSLYVMFFVALVVAYGIEAYRSDRAARQEKRKQQKVVSRLVVPATLGCLLALSGVVLLPNWPYRAFKLQVNSTEAPASLAMIRTGATVLAYPYPTSFADRAMLWQALDAMRFRLIGSYALVPDQQGRATTFPALLSPASVEAMLVNSSTDIPDPDVADAVATSETVEAVSITIRPGSGRKPIDHGGEFIGRIASVDASKHLVYLDLTSTVPIGVALSRFTRIDGQLVVDGGLGALHSGDWAIVTGTTAPGSITPRLITKLRQFLARNHVNAIVDDLGLRDSWQVGLWIDAAIGRPNRAGGGGEIWIDVQHRLRIRAHSSGALASDRRPRATRKAVRKLTHAMLETKNKSLVLH